MAKNKLGNAFWRDLRFKKKAIGKFFLKSNYFLYLNTQINISCSGKCANEGDEFLIALKSVAVNSS